MSTKAKESLVESNIFELLDEKIDKQKPNNNDLDTHLKKKTKRLRTFKKAKSLNDIKVSPKIFRKLSGSKSSTDFRHQKIIKNKRSSLSWQEICLSKFDFKWIIYNSVWWFNILYFQKKIKGFLNKKTSNNCNQEKNKSQSENNQIMVSTNKLIITRYDLSYKSRERKMMQSGSDLKKLLLSDVTSNNETISFEQNENKNKVFKEGDLNNKTYIYRQFVDKVLKPNSC
jgi:hypothetical protein